MLAHHTNELRDLLERVYDVGVGEIRMAKLRVWFAQDRLSDRSWREINEKWSEVLSDADYTVDQIPEIPLMVGESEGLYVFVFGANIQTKKSNTGVKDWLMPISSKFKRAKSTTSTEIEATQ